MKRKKEHVAMAKHACRICNNTEEFILLATKYKDGEPVEDLSPLHNQVVGFIEGGKCKNCIDLYKDTIVLVVCDDEKSEDHNNPWRTGEIIQIKKKSQFGHHLLSNNLVKNDLAYIDEKYAEELKIRSGAIDEKE